MKALRFVLIGIAVAVLIGLGWRWTHTVARSPVTPPIASTTHPANRPTAAEARAVVLSRLGDAPEYAPFFERLRAAFPADYLAVVDASAKAVAGGARVPNPDRLVADAVRNLRQVRGVLAGQAEPLPLGALFGAQAAVLDALAAEPSLCVDFLYGGISPDFMAFAATHRELMERLAIANLTAIASGQTSRIARDKPTDNDFNNLTAALKSKGLNDDEVAALLDGKTFDPPLPDKALCESGRTYLHVLDTLPDESKMRIYALSAALLARS